VLLCLSLRATVEKQFANAVRICAPAPASNQPSAFGSLSGRFADTTNNETLIAEQEESLTVCSIFISSLVSSV
jgi:hypothetical protein